MKKLSIPMTYRETYLGWACLLLQLFCLPALLSLVNQLLEQPLSETLINALYFFLNFCFVLLVFYRFLWKSLHLGLQQPWKTLRSAFLGFAAYYISSYLLNLAITAVMPDFSNVNDNAIASMDGTHFALVTLGIIFLVPITEETLYRGLIFRGLYAKSRPVAYFVSALLFASIHVIGYVGDFSPKHLFLCLIQYFPAGLSLAWAYTKADTIWAPILMHITINQIGVAAMR